MYINITLVTRIIVYMRSENPTNKFKPMNIGHAVTPSAVGRDSTFFQCVVSLFQFYYGVVRL